MKKTIFFSICRYIPSLLRGEKLNIGFAYHIPSTGEMGFFASKNIKRILAFDDEIDAEMVNAIYQSLSYDFSTDNLDDSDDNKILGISDTSLLEKKVYNYVNQIQFGEISVHEDEESADKTLLDIADMYLYFDKPKGKRMDHLRVQALARKIVKASIYKDSLSKSENSDVFYDNPYDFKIERNGNVEYIKGFSFDYQHPNRFYKEMKSYLYDLEKLVSTDSIKTADIKIVINNTDLEKEHEQIIQQYLPEDLRLLTLNKFIEYLN